MADEEEKTTRKKRSPGGYDSHNLGGHTTWICPYIYIPALIALGGVMKYMIADLYVNNLRFGTAAFNAAISKAAFIKIAFCSLQPVGFSSLPDMDAVVFRGCTAFSHGICTNGWAYHTSRGLHVAL